MKKNPKNDVLHAVINRKLISILNLEVLLLTTTYVESKILQSLANVHTMIVMKFFSGSSVGSDDSYDALDGVSISSSESSVESDDSYDALDEVSVSSSVSSDNMSQLDRSEVSLVSKVSDEDSVDL